MKGTRRRGRQKKRWEDNIKEWTGMGFGDSRRAAESGKDGKVLLKRHLWCSDYLQGKGAEMRWACTRMVLPISYKSISITKYGMG